MANQYTNPHRMTHTKFYKLWVAMKQRCNDPATNGYENYGGRGIKVCDEWNQFNNFYNDMYDSYLLHCAEHGENDTSLDRLEIDLGYNPKNCRWVTKLFQQNNKRTNKYFTYKGETASIADLSRKHSMRYSVVMKRLQSGKTIDEALSKPVVHREKYTRNDLEKLALNMANNIIGTQTSAENVRRMMGLSHGTAHKLINKILKEIDQYMYASVRSICERNKRTKHPKRIEVTG